MERPLPRYCDGRQGAERRGQDHNDPNVAGTDSPWRGRSSFVRRLL